MEELVTRKVELDSTYAQAVLGINDDNLRVLNQQLGADIHARGTTVTLRGPVAAVAHATRVLDELESMARRGVPVGPDTVVHATRIMETEAPESVAKILGAEIVARRGKVIRPKPQASAATSTRSTTTPSRSASGLRVRARPTSRWRRRSKRCNPSRSNASS